MKAKYRALGEYCYKLKLIVLFLTPLQSSYISQKILIFENH